MRKRNSNLLKLMGVLATLAGAGITLVSDWVSQKQTEEYVKECVAKALSEQKSEEES